jgi:hypothetical protein
VPAGSARCEAAPSASPPRADQRAFRHRWLVAAAHPGGGDRELRGRLHQQRLWGSDLPFLTAERCLAELNGLGLPAAVLYHVLYRNAVAILGPG